jgi:hypothetical protein
MGFVLPVPPPPPDIPDATAEKWEQAASTRDHSPMLHAGGGSVVMYRSGPGDDSVPNDEWMGIDLRDLGHEGVENGRGLFVEIPGPPPEGHGGYDFPHNDSSVIDRSTQHQALFWSDWAGSTALQAGGRGSFRGEHVIIVRIPPGSLQGYMPSDPGMVQANTDRNIPPPWDNNIVIGGPGMQPAAMSV